MPATLTANAKRRASFGRALGKAMQVRDLTQQQLGDKLGDMCQSSISAWKNGSALPPDIETVYRLEKILKLPAGHLSRLLGFLPVQSAQIEADVTEAVLADDRLDDSARRMILGLYDQLVAGAKSRHPSARQVKGTVKVGRAKTRAA